jgi:2-amino-4-hydroxy-6-hydroxymethyldihydropteridine diphosphokinase
VKKRLSPQLTLYFDRYFPWQNPLSSHKRHTAILGIGGNIGNTRRRFEKLFRYLNAHPLVDLIESSPILQNPPFGYLEQDDFYNAVLVIKTDLSPYRLLRFVLHTEHIFKRRRAFENSPRTLDIDIIVFDKIAVNKRDLTLPHPRFRERDSVMIPLSYLKRHWHEALHIYRAYPRRGAQKGAASMRRRGAGRQHQTDPQKNTRT